MLEALLWGIKTQNFKFSLYPSLSLSLGLTSSFIFSFFILDGRKCFSKRECNCIALLLFHPHQRNLLALHPKKFYWTLFIKFFCIPWCCFVINVTSFWLLLSYTKNTFSDPRFSTIRTQGTLETTLVTLTFVPPLQLSLPFLLFSPFFPCLVSMLYERVRSVTCFVRTTNNSVKGKASVSTVKSRAFSINFLYPFFLSINDFWISSGGADWQIIIVWLITDQAP